MVQTHSDPQDVKRLDRNWAPDAPNVCNIYNYTFKPNECSTFYESIHLVNIPNTFGAFGRDTPNLLRVIRSKNRSFAFRIGWMDRLNVKINRSHAGQTKKQASTFKGVPIKP